MPPQPRSIATADRVKAMLDEVANYYAEKISSHGPSAAGVDWNSVESQELRFEKLTSIAGSRETYSVNDYGCGYGALAAYLERAPVRFDYAGFDIAPEMIEAARERFSGRPYEFTSEPGELEPADYTLASGIFNVRLDADDERWLAHVLETLDEIRRLSRDGFAFNMLTSHSDPERMRPDLYYADPSYMLEHCIRRFGRRVAVLHDYELYEFTVHVRPDG
jgi:SAM-dependent methyltransferase